MASCQSLSSMHLPACHIPSISLRLSLWQPSCMPCSSTSQCTWWSLHLPWHSCQSVHKTAWAKENIAAWWWLAQASQYFHPANPSWTELQLSSHCLCTLSCASSHQQQMSCTPWIWPHKHREYTLKFSCNLDENCCLWVLNCRATDASSTLTRTTASPCKYPEMSRKLSTKGKSGLHASTLLHNCPCCSCLNMQLKYLHASSALTSWTINNMNSEKETQDRQTIKRRNATLWTFSTKWTLHPIYLHWRWTDN